MAVRRALVECAVLSVQESSVFYPCCKQCFSRMELRHDTARCRCSRCGASCPRQQVDYRYRLSMTVARDSRIFGMTVFGGCLNALFGIHASGLQRLVEDSDKSVESPIRSLLLVKAVEDCFIGRHFIFGIKVTDAENGPLFGRPTLGDSSAQFIANQILLPRGAGQGGCSVVRYYQALLQRATEHPLGTTTGPLIASRSSATTAALLSVPLHSPSASFNNTTLPASCLPSMSRRRSLNSEHILSPTPPWQQSLGLITSSAEQEEGCGTQASTGERTHYQTHNNPRALHPAPVCHRSLGAKHKTTDPARVPSSPSLSAYRSSSSCRASPASSIREVDENTPVLHATWFSPSQPVPSRTVPLGIGTKESGSSDGEQQADQANASLSDSVPWEDIFSESLGLFLCEEDNGDVGDRFCKTGPNLVSLCEGVATSGNPLPGDSPQAVSVCQSNAQLMGTHTRRSILPEITNPVDRRSHGVDSLPNLSPQTYRNLSLNENGSLKLKQSPSASFNGDEELPPVRSCDQDGAYDCSADLFNSSLAQTPRTQRNTDSHFDKDSQAHTQEMQDCKTSPDMVHCDSSYIADTQAQNNDAKTAMEDYDNFQCLDFIPPSQSTPLVKRAGHAGLLVPTHVNHASGLLNLQPNEVDSYISHVCTPIRTTLTPRRLTSLRAHLRQTNRTKQSPPCSVEPRKRSLKSKHKSSFWRLDHRSKHSVIMAQRGPAEKTRSHLTCDTSVCDENGLCDNDGTCKTRGPVKCRPREWTDNSMEDFEHRLRGQQTDKQVNYLVMATPPLKTELVHRQTGNGVCNSPGGHERAGSSQNTSAVEVNLDGTVGHLADEESGAYDLSRDLFTDSF